ncbi:MAG: putative LPS assembly protein LptD, partial [Bacteroidia bacterium]
FDYMFKGGKDKQVRHLLIPTLTYLYRPDFGEEQFGFWKKVQRDTLGNTAQYSVFEGSLFNGPVQGEQNTLSFNLSNNIEAKVKHQTDTGIAYKKVVVLQNLSVNGNYNFAADSFNMGLLSVTARNKFFKFFDLVGNASFDPYGYDKQSNRKVSQYAANYNNEIARFVNGNVALNVSLGSNSFEAENSTRLSPNLTNDAERGANIDDKPREKMEWSTNIYYNLTFDKQTDPSQTKIVQTMNFSGSINPTKYWKIGITSGYDFINKQLSYTSFDIYRDLKCWEARINWVPFGFRKSYNLTINLKTSMLSDIKIPRQRQWYDNFN